MAFSKGPGQLPPNLVRAAQAECPKAPCAEDTDLPCASPALEPGVQMQVQGPPPPRGASVLRWLSLAQLPGGRGGRLPKARDAQGRVGVVSVWPHQTFSLFSSPWTLVWRHFTSWVTAHIRSKCVCFFGP